METNRQPERFTVARILIHTLIACALFGCDQGPPRLPAPGDSQIPSSPTPPQVSTDSNRTHGHFQGTAAIGDANYHVEALLTVDGAVRIYIGARMPTGSTLSGGGPPTGLADLEESAMFVGQMEFAGNSGTGDGVIMGQSCAPARPGRFCGDGAAAKISFVAMHPRLTGELRIETAGGEEAWRLDISAFSHYYRFPARRAPTGMYEEELALFARSGDVIITIDGDGQLFFQSPGSGCVGNGSLAPHSNGEQSVWDVELQIENCSADFIFLNRQFDGLATVTQGGYWDYNNCLLMFLSSPRQSESKFAVTTFGCSN